MIFILLENIEKSDYIKGNFILKIPLKVKKIRIEVWDIINMGKLIKRQRCG